MEKCNTHEIISMLRKDLHHDQSGKITLCDIIAKLKGDHNASKSLKRTITQSMNALFPNLQASSRIRCHGKRTTAFHGVKFSNILPIDYGDELTLKILQDHKNYISQYENISITENKDNAVLIDVAFASELRGVRTMHIDTGSHSITVTVEGQNINLPSDLPRKYISVENCFQLLTYIAHAKICPVRISAKCLTLRLEAVSDINSKSRDPCLLCKKLRTSSLHSNLKRAREESAAEAVVEALDEISQPFKEYIQLQSGRTKKPKNTKYEPKLKNYRSDAEEKLESVEIEMRQLKEELEQEKKHKEELERKVQKLEGDSFEMEVRLTENAKQLQDKLTVEESRASELDQEVTKLRMDNEALEKQVVALEQKEKEMIDSIGSAMADLNNV